MNAFLDRLRRILTRARRGIMRRLRRLFRLGDAPFPQDGDFLSGSVHYGFRRRSFRLYIPHGLGDAPVPLMVMLHGCRQTPESFALGTRMNGVADARGFIVLYPGQSRLANPLGCWNWFARINQGRGGEPAMIVQMIDAVCADWPVDARRVFVAGLSAGGAMASTLGNVYPERIAGVGIHSALPGDAARDVPGAYAAMGEGAEPPLTMPSMPVIIFQGETDETVTSLNAERMIEAIQAASPTAKTTTVAAPGWSHRVVTAPDNRVLMEAWIIEGLGHAWSGGNPEGGYAEALGPDASRELMRFFLDAAPASSAS